MFPLWHAIGIFFSDLVSLAFSVLHICVCVFLSVGKFASVILVNICYTLLSLTWDSTSSSIFKDIFDVGPYFLYVALQCFVNLHIPCLFALDSPLLSSNIFSSPLFILLRGFP